MGPYIFWAVVGAIGGLFCFICEEGERMESDRRIMIQFLSLIFGFLIGTTIFGGHEPDGGSWILGLITQVVSCEIVFRLLKPYHFLGRD